MTPSYTMEALAEITGIETATLTLYHEHGIIRPLFDDDTVRCLRRMEHLRECCGMNLDGLKLVAGLLAEVEQLRDELRRLR